MEGVGARLGRSSTRYGPTTVFSGPSNGSAAGTPDIGKDASAGAATPPSAGGEPLRRRFRYIPVFALEEQKQEGKADDESKQDDIEPPVQQSYGDGFDGNDDVQDIVMVEAQQCPLICPSQGVANSDQPPQRTTVLLQRQYRQRVAEANETNLDLSLGLKSHDGDHGTDSKPSV
ncbi:hypothetical protein HPP92_015258 [Vanilla planifolia]|uniref:Uncharacterized protein n=1 Tax=Vanilla planifolia TaxID=51239 RepID=A0A835QXF4_VANPL|nr:hypothetical protein HPP92_015258 [Vanilla planifolia]